MTFTPVTLYFLYFLFSRPESQLCTPQNRTDTCTEEEYNPVCALYSGDDCNSPTGFCYRTLLKTCDACLDPSILGYTPGECEEPTFPQVCTKSERKTSCSNDEDSRKVCGYSKPLLLRGKSMKAELFSSGCDACSSEHVMFHVRGDCKDSGEIGICKAQKRDKGCGYDFSAEPLCAYYTGEGCNEKLCRKSVTVDSCNVCEDSSVLFYVKGACEYVEPGSEDVEELVFDDETDEQELPIPELIPVIQEDGNVVYEEVKPEEESIDVDCVMEEQDDIPLLEPVIQEDGSIIYKIATPKVEEIPSVDISILREKAEEILETLKELQSDIPELEPVMQIDLILVSEEVTPEEPEEPVDVDCIVEQQDYIPELEPVIQEDGTTVYEEVKTSQEQEDIVDVDCIVEPQDDIPELEAVVQADGSVVYEEVGASEEIKQEGTEEITEIESSLPESEPIAKVEETISYEPFVTPSSQEMAALEDELIVPQQIEIIETRLLVEPDN